MDLPYSEEERDWTVQQLRRAHQLYATGNRDRQVRLGQRIYDRLSKRARRARARSGATV